MIAELVGVPEDERHQVFAWTERMMSLDDPELGGTLEDAANRDGRDVRVRRSARRRAGGR